MPSPRLNRASHLLFSLISCGGSYRDRGEGAGLPTKHGSRFCVLWLASFSKVGIWVLNGLDTYNRLVEPWKTVVGK
jgi:hypothetical protein